MGFDAPWTDVMLLYDHQRVIGLGEVKMSGEKWSPSNQAATEDAARRLGVPLLVVRFTDPEGPMTASVYRLAKPSNSY
jgi:hypothetical protein